MQDLIGLLEYLSAKVTVLPGPPRPFQESKSKGESCSHSNLGQSFCRSTALSFRRSSVGRGSGNKYTLAPKLPPNCLALACSTDSGKNRYILQNEQAAFTYYSTGLYSTLGVHDHHPPSARCAPGISAVLTVLSLFAPTHN